MLMMMMKVDFYCLSSINGHMTKSKSDRKAEYARAFEPVERGIDTITTSIARSERETFLVLRMARRRSSMEMHTSKIALQLWLHACLFEKD